MDLLHPFRRPPSSQSVQSVSTALGMARQKLDQLEAAVKLASYEAADPDDQQAQTRLADAKVARSATKGRIADLAAALEVAREREQQANQDKLAEERQGVVAAVLGHLSDRDAAGARLQDHLEQAAFAWREMIAANDAALRDAGGVPLPAAGEVGLGQAKRLVATEMWRALGGDGDIGSTLAMPLVKAPTAQSVNDPKSLPTLADNLRAATAYVRRHLTGGTNAN